MSWTEVSLVHRDRNPRKGASTFEEMRTGEARVYISDRGRLFSDAELNGANGRGRHRVRNAMQESPDVEDDDGLNAASPWHWQMFADHLTATRVFTEGASRLDVFAQADGSCRLQVILGKENGAILRTGGKRNAPEQVLSNETHDGTCQIVQGNVLAR